jgi:uncharacterized damage-inducible protein DinB
MLDLNQTIASNLAGRYQKLAGVLQELPMALTDDQFWTKPFNFGNSCGHLVLHLTGNLNYYIGAQIAGTGYVRDRPQEFSDATRASKSEVLKKFNQAIDMVIATIKSQSAEDWAKPYTAAGSDADNRFGILLSCATHLHLHIGQMMYLVAELRRAT